MSRGPVQFFTLGEHPLLFSVTRHLIASGYELIQHYAAADSSRPVFAVFGAEARNGTDGVSYLFSQPSVFGLPVLCLSSSSVYSDRDHSLDLRPMSPCNEGQGHVITSPLDPTAFKPLAALLVEHQLTTRHSGNTIVVRPFNVYGPSFTEEECHIPGVVDTFVSAAEMNKPLEVHTPGRQVRTFLHVDDFNKAIDGLLPRLLSGGRGIYNVGSDDQVEIMSLAKSVKHAFNKDLEIVVVDDPSRHVWWCIPDTTRIRVDAKWRTTTSLRSGLFAIARMKE